VTTGEVLMLRADAIHDVHTPDTTHSAALHVYLGDITATQRSRWDDADSQPLPFDGEEHERLWMEAALVTGLVARPSGSSNHP
jgi:predicted metal-dependent enzyme (double-stranded beta helix superfamily)